MIQKLLSYIEEHQQELFKIHQKLIQINTENFGNMGREKELSEYLDAQLKKLGVESDVYSPEQIPGIRSHPDYLPGRNLEDRPNVTGRIPGRIGKKSLMLAGHLDTMPIGEENLWSVHPTQGIIRDGRIYGRGSCDDKYALSTWLFLVQAMKHLGIQLKNDLYVAGYVDEEFGGGNGALACCLKYPCDFVMNMDCMEGAIFDCGAGGQRLVIHIKTDHIQHSCDRVLNGIILCKEQIDRFGSRRFEEMHCNPRFAGHYLEDMAMRYMSITSGLNINDKNMGALDIAFYTDASRETIRQELETLFADINTALKPLDMYIDRVDYRSRLFNYGAANADGGQIGKLQNAVEKITGKVPEVLGQGLSDLNIFLTNGGKKAVSFGAGRGFELYGGAHRTDEFIECSTLVTYTKIVAQFIMDWDETDD